MSKRRIQPRPALADRRQKAVDRVLFGEQPGQVMRDLGLNRHTIYKWLKSYRQQGARGLQARRARGRQPKLKKTDLYPLLPYLTRSPRQAGIEGVLWQQQSLAELICQKLDIDTSATSLRHFMKQCGIRNQRLQDRLSNSSSPAVAEWLASDYPQVLLRTRRQKNRLFLCELISANISSPIEGTAVLEPHYFLSATPPNGHALFMAYKKKPGPAELYDFLQKLADLTEQQTYLLFENNPRMLSLVSGNVIADKMASKHTKISLLWLPSLQNPELDQALDHPLQIPDNPCTQNVGEWLLLLSQSLLDLQYPFNEFLLMLRHCLHGNVVIASNLSMPASLIRPVSQDSSLTQTIFLNKSIMDSWQTNPLLSQLKKPGDLYALCDIANNPIRKTSRFLDLSASHGIDQALGLCFSGPEDTLCGLFILRHLGNAPFSEREMRFIRTLQKPLEAAMATAVQSWRSSYMANALAEATDHLEIAALLLDGNGHIIKTSGMANLLIEERTEINRKNHQLEFLNADYQGQFSRAVNAAIAWRQAPIGDKPVEAMRFSYASGVSLGILVQPITPPSMLVPHSVAVSPHVIVYISDPGKARPGLKHQLIMRLFGLSVREAHLVTLLTERHSLGDAAKAMNITQATARSYLQHIYEKVGVNRREDLIQRIMKSVATLA